MRVVIAPDSYKGVLASRAVAESIARGLRRVHPSIDIELAPMADGGEGTLDIVIDATEGQRRRVMSVGPLGRSHEGVVGLIHEASVAVIESAQVVGMSLVPTEERNPMKASTYGLGQVIQTVIESGMEDVIIALGDSATVDGGAGMMQGLGMTFSDTTGRTMDTPIGGGDLQHIRRFQWARPPENIEHVQFTLACDVLNPACGRQGAAAIFAPQKGADAQAVENLQRGLARWADLLECASRRAVREEPGTGAAGGVALPLLALCGASVVPGVDWVSECIGLPNLISGADLVITGEGCLDHQSMMGKVVGAIGRMCRAAGVPCVALVGATGKGVEECLSVLDQFYTLDCEPEQTALRLEKVAGQVADEWL